MTDETFFVIVFSYVLINIVLFISHKYTRKYKKTHRVISVIDNLLFVVLLEYGFYQWNPWLIILVPCVLLVIYPIAWGMNEELTDDEVASIVISTSSFLVNEALRRKLKLYFAYVATFPFYYLLHSWKK